MTDDNIYTIALKYGVDNLNKEVTYNKLLDHLSKQNIILDQELKRYFHIWFYESFYVETIYQKIKDFKWTSGDLGEKALKEYDDRKAIITGASHQTYQDTTNINNVSNSKQKEIALFGLTCKSLLQLQY